MKKIFTIALLLVTMMLAGCGGDSDKSNAPTSNKYSKIITVGVDDEFAPICFRDDKGELVGFDIDLAKEAAKRMGVEFEFKPIDWDKKESEITSGNIDMIWNGCDIMDEYKQYMIFSKPYMDNRQILLVKKGNPHDIHSLGDLENKIVATQSGSNSEIYINDNNDLKETFKDFVTYRNVKEGFEGLTNDKFDVLIIDEIAARYELIKTPRTFEVVEVTVGPFTEFGIGFSKGNTELRATVQKAFDSMVADGTAQQISEKWFQADLIKHKR